MKILQLLGSFNRATPLQMTASLVTLTNGQVSVHLNNFIDSPYTLKRGTQVANFTILTPIQMKNVKPINPVTTWHLLHDNPENAAHYASSLIKSKKPEDFTENTVFPHLNILDILSITHQFKNEICPNCEPFKNSINLMHRTTLSLDNIF